ncbi:uncharacterized protein LOC111685870 [Lucilia cuprina]|uniref:uncharacterized protein LOC111685870 n=1 Tax=Lucilia cuprina TaxID=7375 RepID=UPI001F060A52|nr:uncharacterized protein LOC111685870 [Lucilia cuprina]
MNRYSVIVLKDVVGIAADVVFKAFPCLLVGIADDDNGNILALFWSFCLGDPLIKDDDNDDDVSNVVADVEAVVVVEFFVPLSAHSAAAIPSSSSTAITSTTTPTTILPQTNLLKIEPFVPSLTNRPQKTIRRSYSTLSNTTLKKHSIQHVNKNLVNQLEIQKHAKTLAGVRVAGNIKGINSVNNGLPKVLRQTTTATSTTTLRRRPTLRGPINRQRSKSTSSSNSNSNRPITAGVAVSATPIGGTPCTSPYSAVVVQQPNGICRIQRNAKELEKLPDRINYDKRGLTAIPIFENETNLRLLSLQHNLINTFHIPKEQDEMPEEEQVTAETETATREQVINGISCRNAELNISGNQTHQHFYNNKQRLPLAVAKPNLEQLQPQVPGQLMLPLNAPPPLTNPMTFGSYILQRNKLLHRSINMNNCQVNNHRGNLQHPAQLRFSMRKSKSFVSNLNLQLNLTKRSMQNQKTAFLKRTDVLGNLKSFDSSTSNITTDSTQSTLLTTEVDESLVEDEEEEDRRSNTYSPLAIKNKQLIISYGNIFQNLVFLDLYDNQIERVSNLDGLPALTVLLLGKNRISDITGLASLKSTLRVLDLHGNKLCSISNKINCLKELKSLNLAGNQIRQINHNDFMGLHNLKELNLKRNKLKRINGFQHLSALERLWLCHNDLHKVDDMASIAKAQNLVEITIENNPLTLAGDCVSFLVSYLPKLQTLSQMPITEQVRKAAMTWRANKELSDANSNLSNREVFNIIRREEIISNARTNWELLRSQQMVQNSLKQQKAINKPNMELEKIRETNENNYEEFIKLPPIESQQIAEGSTNKQEIEERSSSASSLGANVNSSSSCYSSQDELDATGVTSKAEKPLNHIDKPPSSSSSIKSKQMENIINHTSSTDNNHQHQHHSSSQCNSATTTETSNTPTITSASNSAPTLNLQFPMETNKVSANQQNQAVTSTVTSVSSSISSIQTAATNAMVSSSMAVVSPASATFTKRYMTGSLMRSQTIVGTVTGAGGIAVGVGGNTGGYTNGYTVKTNTVATANNIRYQSKLNPNATTQTAAITTLQQTITTSAAITTTMMMTTTTTTTGYSIAGAIANSNNNITNNSLMASSMNSNNTSLTSNTNKTSVTGASNSITGIAAHTTTSTANTTAGPCGATSTKLTAIEREREQGGDYLIEICGRYLNIYGQGALRFIDKQWNPTKANDVHTLNFSYINFNNIASILGRIKVRFAHAENFVFRETNINCLGQLNALAELQGISSLNIDEEGNPITNKDLWRQYAIYRLSHWGLKTLNGIEVTAQEIEKANAIYAGLSDLILWSMPDAMLQPLLTRLRLDESCTASKLLPKQWLRKPDNKSLRLVVGKEALQWKKTNNSDCQHLPTPQQVRHLQNQYYSSDTLNTNYYNQTLVSSSSSAVAMTSPNVSLTTRERGKIHFTLMMENTCNAVEKLHKVEQIWPTMLLNIVRNTLLDYSQLDVYIRNLMAEIMK